MGKEHAITTLTIDAFTQENLELREQIVSLEADCHAYRELAQMAITALHDQTNLLERMKTSHYRLIDEYRALRVQVLLELEAAA